MVAHAAQVVDPPLLRRRTRRLVPPPLATLAAAAALAAAAGPAATRVAHAAVRLLRSRGMLLSGSHPAPVNQAAHRAVRVEGGTGLKRVSLMPVSLVSLTPVLKHFFLTPAFVVSWSPASPSFWPMPTRCESSTGPAPAAQLQHLYRATLGYERLNSRAWLTSFSSNTGNGWL